MNAYTVLACAQLNFSTLELFMIPCPGNGATHNGLSLPILIN